MIELHRFNASRLATCCLLIVCVSAVGCKFGKLTNRSMDYVDRKNDRCTLYLDHLYSPGLDLTRAGKPDWGQSTPACIARRTCMVREGARDVPEPSFVVYPQPAELQLGGGYSTSAPNNRDTDTDRATDTDSPSGDLLPPSPSEAAEN